MSDQNVLILRTRKCRKSDVIINFLKDQKIPHTVRYLDNDAEARQLAIKYDILASPGIIVNNQSVNPYHLVEKCRVKEPEKTKQMFQHLLDVDGK